MVCIYCNSDTNIKNSRHKVRLNTVWRRRVCLSCSAIFTTNEEIDYSGTLSVKKKIGAIEPFYKEKIFISVYRSLDHKTSAQPQATAITNTVISKLLSTKKTIKPLINSSDIALVVTKTLKNFDASSAIKYQSYQKNLGLAKDIRRTLNN
ncbi:hypothetical protein KA043_03865 [Candidatus Saccharibacteria bacterium]|nr:hypothetical protein [Candidatus Saccharibacteria bacterium]